MVESISIQGAQVISIVLHSLFYGIYLVLFGGSVFVLAVRPSAHGLGKVRPMNRTLFCVSICLAGIISLNWVMQIIELFETFHLRAEAKAPDTFHEYITSWKYLFTVALSAVETMIADGTMIYRLYHVWGGKWWVIVLPVITGVSACAIAIVAGEKLVFMRKNPNYFDASLPWDVAFIALEFVTSGITASLIAYRIWSVEKFVRASESRSNSRAMPVVAIIVESAAAISGMLFVVLVAFLTKSGDVQTIVLDALSPIIGIAFSLIIIRVGLGLATEDRAESTNLSRSLHFGAPVNHGGIMDAARVARSHSAEESAYGDEEGEIEGDTITSEGNHRIIASLHRRSSRTSDNEVPDPVRCAEDVEDSYETRRSNSQERHSDGNRTRTRHDSSGTLAAGML